MYSMNPVADMLSGIRNAGMAKKEVCIISYSNFKHAICSALEKAGYVGHVSKKTLKNGRYILEIPLVYTRDGSARIHEINIISKPSRRMYMGASDIRPFKNGVGSYFFSTPKGVLEGKDAKKEMVGGEVLFSIW
jgi:small subunit ribosomal protein S8